MQNTVCFNKERCIINLFNSNINIVNIRIPTACGNNKNYYTYAKQKCSNLIRYFQLTH